MKRKGTFGSEDREDRVEKLREDQDQLPGQLASQTRLIKHDRRVYNAFNSLELGFDVEAAIEFIKPSAAAIGVPQTGLGRMIGWCLSFGIVCVEAERERQQEEQRMQDEKDRTTETTETTETTHTEETEHQETPAPETDSGDGEAQEPGGDGEGDGGGGE